MFTFDGAEKRIVDFPIAGRAPGTSTIFLVTRPPNRRHGVTDAPNVFKMVIRNDTDRLGISARDAVMVAVASAVAPGLGAWLHSLPAALYWADGFAKTGEEKLKFRGWPVRDL